MAETVSREIRLKNRPVGLPRESDFELATVPIPTLVPARCWCATSICPLTLIVRGRMLDQPGYVQPFQVGQPSMVAAWGRWYSRKTRSQVGDYILGRKGWREYYVSDGAELTKIDPNLAPVQTYLGTLGMPGLTAYVGLLDMAPQRPGETCLFLLRLGSWHSSVSDCQVTGLPCRGSAGRQTR
jgi:NADPH-dependent curcumin reductase CurA